jgi:dATP pyrophosphohydrolase
MARSPRQSIVIPFIKKEDDFEFAIFQRKESSGGFWQWISGGAEDEETPKDAAIRELMEEASVADFHNIYKLESMCTIQKTFYKDRDHWDDSILVVPEYSFAIELSSKNITISSEHQDYKWVSYEEAMSLLKWDSNKTALWEFCERSKTNRLAN